MCRTISLKGIRYYFAWAACRLSTENGELASLKSVMNQGMKDHDTCVCIFNESVGL